MPDEAYWDSFFQPEGILDRLLVTNKGGCYNLVEFGCGYGTFSLPAAKRTRGTVTALDIEPMMVELVAERAKADGLLNVRAELRDFVETQGAEDAVLSPSERRYQAELVTDVLEQEPLKPSTRFELVHDYSKSVARHLGTKQRIA